MRHSHEMKLDQALAHLNRAETEMSQWLQLNGNSIVREFAGESGEYVFMFRPVTELAGERLGLLIGDCVHNLRSALDHLVFALAVKRYGEPLPGRAARTSEFPIFGDRPMNPTEEKARIGCIDPSAQAIIKGLQPHLRGNDYTSDPLWLIHELDRIDKHRKLHVIALAYYHGEVMGANVFIERISVVAPGQPIKNGVQVGRLKASPVFPDQPMDVYLQFSFQIALAGGFPLGNEPLIPNLRRLTTYVQDSVITPLTKFL